MAIGHSKYVEKFRINRQITLAQGKTERKEKRLRYNDRQIQNKISQYIYHVLHPVTHIQKKKWNKNIQWKKKRLITFASHTLKNLIASNYIFSVKLVHKKIKHWNVAQKCLRVIIRMSQ